MRCIPTTLLLAVALVASGSCLAQQAAAKTPPAHADAATAAAEVPAEASIADAPTRSAFGKVIAIMISSLQREARDGAHPATPVHTSAAGTPLGIEVGDACRQHLSRVLERALGIAGDAGQPLRRNPAADVVAQPGEIVGDLRVARLELLQRGDQRLEALRFDERFGGEPD